MCKGAVFLPGRANRAVRSLLTGHALNFVQVIYLQRVGIPPRCAGLLQPDPEFAEVFATTFAAQVSSLDDVED